MNEAETRRATIALAQLAVLECWYRGGVYGGVYGTLDYLNDALDHIAETGEYPPWLTEEERPPDSERRER